jgi:TRAP transporter 4TM/12TM fusion protein
VEIDGAPSPAEAAEVQKLVEDQEFGSRVPRDWSRRLIPVIAACWSLFQLSLPYLPYALELLPGRPKINSDIVRGIHLSFAIALVFLSYSALKRRKRWLPRWLSFLHADDRIPVLDIVLAVAAASAALYYVVCYAEISNRSGDVYLRDRIAGVVLIILLLEAARRSLGPALSVIALFFLGYVFLADRMPSIIAGNAKSLDALLSKQTLSTGGIYGIPLRVSARTVFLFVLFGMMLEKSGGGRFFVQLAFSLVGRFRGGPAKAAVLASGLTGMVSGSSIANTVTTGTFTIPLMKKSGYPPEKAAAVEVAASTNGQLMPPIMGAAAFIIAEYCNMPYLEVVKAAFIPAVVSYLALIYITHLEACKLGLRPVPREKLPRFWPVLKSGVHYLLPLGLLVFLLLKRYSPQFSVFWCILALAALIFLKNGVNAWRSSGRDWKPALRLSCGQIWQSLVAGGRSMMAIGVACAAAGIIVGVVSMGLGEKLTALVESLAGNSFILVLIFTAIASLILGMGLPTTATYVVMATLTAQIIVTISKGMDVDFGQGVGQGVPPIAAHLFCFFFGILADDTPPVGLAAYAASAIARSKPIPTGVQGFTYDLRTAILPFFFVLNPDLLLWKIDSFWRAAVIFAASTVAMFSFAALTQWFTVARNRWYESLMLGLSALILLRPQWPGEMTGLESKPAWYLIGTALYAGVIALQWPRRTPGRAPASGMTHG